MVVDLVVDHVDCTHAQNAVVHVDSIMIERAEQGEHDVAEQCAPLTYGQVRHLLAAPPQHRRDQVIRETLAEGLVPQTQRRGARTS